MPALPGRLGVEPGERRMVATAFLLFFCVLCGYFMLRPVRETIGTVLGEGEVENLFVATWLGSVAVIPLYGWACVRLRRTTVLAAVYGLFAISLLVLAGFMGVDAQEPAAARFFYVWISVFNLLVVSVFWTLMVDRMDDERARRLFGIVAAGGTTGGLVAPLLTDVLIGPIGRAGILVVSACLFATAVLCQALLLRQLRRDPAAASAAGADRPIGGNPFAGISLVLRSPYLITFCAFVLLLASVTTFLYFEQLHIVAQSFPDEDARTRVFARIDFVVQALTLATQIFFTGSIARRLGVVVLLCSVPVAMVGGFLALSVVANVWILAAVMIARRAGEYALTRPGREILFTSVDTETKYKAKNLIDVVVYRGGDALSAQLRGGLRGGEMTSAALAVVGAGIAVVWGIVGYWLARRHAEDTSGRSQG
jgi:AAA family ATP:ADP antiporter